MRKNYPSLMRKIAKIANHFKKVHKKKSRSFPYKIVKVESVGKWKPYAITVQVDGKNLFFEKTPGELYESLLEGFSPLDIWKICCLWCEEKNAPQYEMISRHYCSDLERDIFTFKDRGTGGVVAMTDLELFNDTMFLKKLSQLDAYRVGCAIGEISNRLNA